jgi:hypothetical protein
MTEDELVGPGVPGGSPPGDVIPRLMQSCPSLAAPWQAHLDEWGGDEPGIYNDAAVAAHFFVELLEARNVHELAAGFATVEDLLLGGDRETRAMLIVGLIEDVQNISSNRGHDSTEFRQFLGPETSAAWERVHQYWQAIGARSLADVIRAEMGQRPSSPAVDPARISDGRLRRMVEGLSRRSGAKP